MALSWWKSLAKTNFLKKIFLTKKSRQVEERFLRAHASTGKTLDIGAKNRSNARFFPNLTTMNIEAAEGVDAVGSAEDMRELFSDESFDVVLCLSVLEHAKEPGKIVSEIGRALKTGGLAIVAVPFIMPLHDTPADYWRFTRYGLVELFKNFELVEIKENMDALQSVGYLYHRFFLQTDTLRTRVFSIIFFFASKFHYAVHFLITREYGYANHSRAESGIAANGILAVFKKRMLSV